MSQGKRVQEKKPKDRSAAPKKTGGKKRVRALKAILIIIALFIAGIAGLVYYMTSVAPKQKEPPIPPVMSGTGDSHGGEDDPPEIPEKKLKESFYTFLLVGTNDDYNADTIMLGSIDMESLECHVISIPRDSFIDTTARIKRINGSYGREGIDGLCAAVYGITGVYPQYYAILNMKSFVKVVDVIGGVYFNVPMRMYHPDAQSEFTIDLQKGWQTLDGKHALQMVRFRGMKGSDFGRQDLQKEFLVATLKQVREKFTLAKAGEIIEAISKSIKTNMSVKDMVWFYTNAVTKMDLEESITFHTMPYTGTGLYESQDYVFLDEEGIVELINQTVNPYTTDITAEEINVVNPKK